MWFEQNKTKTEAYHLLILLTYFSVELCAGKLNTG